MVPSQKSLCCCKSAKKQVVRHKTADGAVKCVFHIVFCNVQAYVSCRDVLAIARSTVKVFVALSDSAEKDFYSSLTDRHFCRGVFVLSTAS
jgi:hypothetical protein